MIKLIRQAFQQFIDDIDAGNSHITEEQEIKVLKLFQEISSNELSKIEAANYIGVCRATFDNYIKKGLLPKGTKRQGFKELFWNKSILEDFKKTIEND